MAGAYVTNRNLITIRIGFLWGFWVYWASASELWINLAITIAIFWNVYLVRLASLCWFYWFFWYYWWQWYYWVRCWFWLRFRNRLRLRFWFGFWLRLRLVSSSSLFFATFAAVSPCKRILLRQTTAGGMMFGFESGGLYRYPS